MNFRFFLLAVFLFGCASKLKLPLKSHREIEWDEPCHDESYLLATTTGSLSEATCSNRLHRMHVQVATHPSNEEIGALVFCECVRPRDADAGQRP